MSHPKEDRDAAMEDRLEIPPPPRPTRNRGPSRCYNFTMIVAFFVMLIIAVVALGAFGKKQAEISQRFRAFGYTDKTCILFATTTSVVGKVRYVDLHPAGLCGYVLWGLASVAIVIFVWIVYSIVLTAIGPKVISILRVLDLVVIALTCLLSFSLSITIHSGVDATCRVEGQTGNWCGPFVPQDHEGMLEFYDELNSAKVSSWTTTMLLLGLSVWYAFLMVIYCYRGSQRRKQAQQYSRFERQDKELPAHV